MSSGDAKADYARLVKAAAEGDRGSMEALLVRAQEAAYRFSLLVCGRREDAEDVMQDALFKTYRHVGQISDPGAFRTWLYSTVRNACLMKRRRRSGEPATFVEVPIDLRDPSRPADQQLIEEWVDGRLRAALKKLPPSYRMVVVMREIEGLSTREVAAIAEISEATVKQRLHRARLMLRKHLERI